MKNKEIDFNEFRSKPNLDRPDGKSALKDRRFSDNRNLAQEALNKLNGPRLKGDDNG